MLPIWFRFFLNECIYFIASIGLHRDDCLDFDDPDVVEAIRRLPKHVYDCRNWRIKVALHHSMMKTILPKEEWITYEEDCKYLTPYLEEVIEERKEREEWGKLH